MSGQGTCGSCIQDRTGGWRAQWPVCSPGEVRRSECRGVRNRQGLVTEAILTCIKIQCPHPAIGTTNSLLYIKEPALSHRLICWAAADHKCAAESRLPCTAFSLELLMRCSELKQVRIQSIQSAQPAMYPSLGVLRAHHCNQVQSWKEVLGTE